LEAAAEKYEEAIPSSENLEDFRQVAVGKGQLATVRMDQGRYDEAIAEHEAARTLFEQQNEPQCGSRCLAPNRHYVYKRRQL
jgi:hypothetical protein